MRKVNRNQILRELWEMVEKMVVLHSENAGIGGTLSPSDLLFLLSRKKHVQVVVGGGGGVGELPALFNPPLYSFPKKHLLLNATEIRPLTTISCHIPVICYLDRLACVYL